MRNDRLVELERELTSIVGIENILKEKSKTLFYRTGIRVGLGSACFVVLPRNLLHLWKILKICTTFDKIIIIQAANTGLTGGSTPDGDNYDRDIVIINTIYLDQLVLLNGGLQVIAFPGTTLYKLEEKLSPLNRAPHSVIGSSCIGASVVGGICNNSGGNLVNRGPAYTELSIFARLNSQGELELINHLDIDLGKTPEEILINLECSNFQVDNLPFSNHMASDVEYQLLVRDIKANTPARFNADSRRLYESSGCAGKIAVFAVRLDTFALPEKEQVFFVGTNDPSLFTVLRKKILTNFKHLPDMGEYIHRSYFDGADNYCKDTFLFIKYFGPSFIPRLISFKRKIDQFFTNLPFIPTHFSDKFLQSHAALLPDHLPARIREYRNRYEHYMVFLASDACIESTKELLELETSKSKDYNYMICTKSEGRDLLLHRYVAGAAPMRFRILNLERVGEILPLDIALPRNFESWHDVLPSEILSKMEESFQMGHFMCMVFHWDFVVRKDIDKGILKDQILKLLDKIKAKYPAEHNVGHLYKADYSLESFYRKLDPTNTFNSGIGKMSKNQNYE